MARDREDDEYLEDVDLDNEELDVEDDDDLEDDDLEDQDLEDQDLGDEDLEINDDVELDDLDLDEVEFLDGFDLDDEDIDLKVAFGLPDRLPPLRLPPEAELAAMSRTSPLLARARRLADWVAALGRDLAEDEELTAQDTVAAAFALGITVPVEADADPEALPGMPAPPAVTGMQDVPELARLWDIAVDVGFLEVDVVGARVQPGEEMGSWPGGTDEEVLDVWSTALPTVLEWLEDDADLDDRLGELLDFTDAGWALMVVLFLARAAGLPVQEASDVIRQAVTDELTSGQEVRVWQAWTRAHGDPAEELLSRLAELGAVWLPDQGSEEGPVARLTPLGTWAVRDLLVEDDVEIPLLPPSEEMTAADLIAAAPGLGEEELEAETAAWLGSRAPDAAAGELLGAAADTDPAERMFAVATVQKLGAAAEPAWRDALARPELRPYAKMALTEIADGEPGITVPAGLEPEDADIAWVLIDLLAGILDSPDRLSQIGDAIPAGAEQQVLEAMSESPHPDAAAVLSLIGKHHPDKQVAKAARRSAHKAGSRPQPRADA